jgi:hypothetical protein
MVDRRTCLILRGRHSAQWYGNGEPRWTEGKRQRPCTTAEEATEKRKKIVKLLEKHGGKNPAADRLRKRLEGCKPERRCLGGACPECTRAHQRWLVSELNALLKSEGDVFRVVSIVPDLKTPEGKLQ